MNKVLVAVVHSRVNGTYLYSTVYDATQWNEEDIKKDMLSFDAELDEYQIRVSDSKHVW